MPVAHNFTASPPNRLGFFSPQTAAVNFCEIDYAATPYVAEFINALTNFAYIYLSTATLAPGVSSWNILSWPLANISLLFVGIGSFSYHATLKHSAQMADELSMYAIITTLNYRVYTHKLFTSPLAKRTVGLTLILATAVVGCSNITSADGASTHLHLALFVILLTTFWPRALFLIHHDNSCFSREDATTSPSAKVNQSRAYQHATRHRRLSSFRLASFSFVLGFIFWLIDGLCCEQLRTMRAKVGLPFAWLLEFHGAWHILTAVGAGMFVRLVAELTRDGGDG
jgi:dihydroceramidase